MTTGIKDSAFRAYEEYVLKDKKVEEGLKNLIEGSDTYNYLKCIDLLTKKGLSLTHDEKVFVESYIFRSNTTESRKIAIRYDLLQYDAAKSEEERKKILERISGRHLGLRFDHQRPGDLGLKASDRAEAKTQKKEGEGKSLLDEVNMTEELNKLYNREYSPNNFNKQVLTKVQLDKLRKEDFQRLLQTMGEDILMLDGNDTLYTTYAKWLAEDYKKNKYYSVDPNILRNMTIEQMDKLRSKLPGISEDATFAGIYTSKKFNRELSEEENSHLTYREKRQNLVKMYDYAKTLPYKLSGLKSSLLLEILENGLKIDVYDEGYFMEYLKLPARENFVKKIVAPSVDTWRNYIQNVQAEHNKKGYSSQLRDKDKELLTKYLEHFFLQGKTVDKFNDYLDQRFLVSVWEDTMLMLGKKVEFTAENTSRLEKLGTEVKITIGDQNKDVFDIGEDVSLWVELKNVPTLFIKVFEINTENYYRKNMSPFRTDVNLDGLIASIERTAEYKQPPHIKFREELKFPELKGKVGLYVIEMIGNGKSSRAVIKIGTLSVITRQTVAGQLCYILDGERKVCCHDSTGIWMDNQYFKANTDKGGRIMIPYLPSGGTKTAKAILLHQGLAQLVDFTRMEEVYTLMCGFYLLPESVIMGKNATIMIRPQLLVNGRLGDLGLLKNIRCVLYTSNFIDNIPSTKTFSNLTLSENNELLIKFQVGANIKDMRIEFLAEIQNITKDTKETLSCSHDFEFVTHVSDHSIAELYLRMNPSKEYELLVLGKNGEPIGNSSVRFTFASHLFTYNKDLTGTTNDQGVIRLGKLKGIRNFTANFQQSSGKTHISKTWFLPSQTVMQYPTYIDIVEDEPIELPISIEHADSPLYLRSVDQVMTLFNASSNIKVEKEKNTLYGMIRVKGLKSGTYLLTGIGEERIRIRVHKGAYWTENPNYILKQYSLLENSERQGFIKIKGVNFEEAKDGKAHMKVQIEGATKDQWRVHVLLFRYLPENLDELSLRLLAKDEFVGSEYFFQKWTNFYLSNRELSSEFRYCFERRHQPRFTGNTLDKPKLILKRTLIQSTHTQQEMLSSGTSYDYVQERAPPPPPDYDMMTQQVIAPSASYRGIEKRRAARPVQYGKMAYTSDSRRSSMPGDRISVYQNFLGLEPLMRYNLPANPDGSLIIELDEKFKENYGCALILAVDKGSVAHYLHPFSGTKIDKRDLSLAKALDIEKSYSEMRTTKCVEKYDTYLIDDITSTDLQIVDSLEKVILVIKELMRLHGVSIKDFDKFERLVQWGSLGEEEKNKMMSRYTSHELHLFIYKKDPEYFNKVVKVYLQNKMEKTFIDYYLLGNITEMLEFANSPSMFESMNPLEKALLVEALVLNGKKDLAKGIAQRMRNALLSQKKTAAEQNRIFDTVLSLGALKTTKDDIEKLIEKEKRVAERAERHAMASRREMALAEESASFSGEHSEEEEFDYLEDEAYEQEEEDISRFRNVAPRKMMSKPNMYKNVALESNVGYMHEARMKQKLALEEMGETKEYAETHYYGKTSVKNWKNQVTESSFWADYAEYFVEINQGKTDKPFLTHQFINTYHTLTEIVGALTLLDLPYYSMDHGFRTMEGRSAELKAASNLVIFKKEIKESKGEIRSNILVAQRYVDWEQRGDEDQKIEEFLVNHIYVGQVIITNISSHKLEFDVLLQIPQGSLPIGASPYQKSHSLSLNSYSTTKLEYMFYFPAPGKFLHFPANVSINSTVVAKSNTETLNVLREKTKISEENFREVLSTANHDLILNFVKEKPIDGIKGFSWNDLYWLLKDKKFYESFVNLLKQQHRFENIVWSYSLSHKSREDMIVEYLNSLDHFKQNCGYYFDSKLLKVRPIDSGMRHLDYYPLVNPRAHKNILSGALGSSNTNQPMILNANLYLIYKMFILYLIEKPVWDLADKMNLAYYLLLQDRVPEALNIFSKIDPENETKKEGRLKLQYDYMAAYLDFYIGAPDFKIARKIVAEYLNYPVITWRLMFLDMDQQLKEYDGINIEEDMENVEEEERKEVSKKKKIKTETQLNIALEGKDVVVDYNNITEVTVKYYIIDLEILFSRTPFLTQNAEDFSYVKPNSSESIALDPKMKEHRIRIPEKYGAKNVVIEVNGGGIQRLVTYFSTSLKLQIFENYGELKVTDEAGKQLAQVYVKAFVMKKDGAVAFYKDGYTDIRGRFDYVSLNASQLANAKKFALFVMSDKYGSLIRECTPPPTTIRPEEDFGPVKTRVANYYNRTQQQQQFESKMGSFAKKKGFQLSQPLYLIVIIIEVLGIINKVHVSCSEFTYDSVQDRQA
eukprot:TRINITY_DN4_c0_g1_i6.p1 TRINITY_DN4_c0_g1~~TRINITY_DN4_c0_g1_i6.p1  ORF type:complete len:2304 (-),score=338.43 TRINITY_DN4_c0_g1_i6:3914-10825(-)